VVEHVRRFFDPGRPLCAASLRRPEPQDVRAQARAALKRRNWPEVYRLLGSLDAEELDATELDALADAALDRQEVLRRLRRGAGEPLPAMRRGQASSRTVIASREAHAVGSFLAE
jgi:hypothetical protein